ncbi:MAG: fumarylacetoacetate hydrolase [Burkholderiales bacterium RIFCSPLOWO2_02_FULL_57_36]|nr:MAG: fumarylacetoacetate hydrolase [Burkholderiales bacterium RIFCSPLOWO2_02_FULL_57_36]
MNAFVIDPPTIPAVGVAGSSQRFPVRRVFCVGRNYAAHAREMGNDPSREPPFFFTKPADAVVPASGQVPYPPLTSDLHHEVEMVVAIGAGGRNISADKALDMVWGYGVGLDLTRRDLQAEAKKLGRPWDWAKGFDASAVCSDITPVKVAGHPTANAIWLKINGEMRQQGTLDEMIWPVSDVIAAISQSVALMPGDLIFTGTPAGVGALQPGDRVTAGVDGIAEIAFEIGPRPV